MTRTPNLDAYYGDELECETVPVKVEAFYWNMGPLVRTPTLRARIMTPWGWDDVSANDLLPPLE